MSRFSSIRNMFNLIDLYGFTFHLRYKKHKTYNTLCGIILSIITIFGIIGILLFYLIKIINRSDMFLISNKENLNNKQLFNFSNNPILIGYYHNGRPIEINAKYIRISLDKNDHYPDKDEDGIINIRRESTSIKLEKCDINIHFNNTYIKELIKEVEYEKYLCPVPGQNLSIGGRWSDNIHGYDILEFHVIKCENTTKNKNCKSEEEMQPYFENAYLSIIYLAQSLDHYDFYNPIKEKFRSEMFSIVNSLVKRYYYYFLPGKYISDNGFIFNNIKTFDFFEYNGLVADFIEKEEQEYYSKSVLAEVCLTSVDKVITYERKYFKLEDYLGNIAGCIKFILIIGQFINDSFSEKIFLLDIINYISSPFSKNISRLKIKKIDDFNKENQIKEGNNINNKLRFSKISMMITMKENKNENFNYSNFPIIEKKIIKKHNLENKKNIKLKIFEFLLPLCLIKKNNKNYLFLFYKDLIYRGISLEKLIPLIERILKSNIINNNENDYLTIMNSSEINTKTNIK